MKNYPPDILLDRRATGKRRRVIRQVRLVALAALAVWCALAAPWSTAQPVPPITQAPAIMLSSSLGAFGGRGDPLVDPNPLFLFPGQTTMSTLTIQSIN